MASLNKVLLMGNLTRNPELRYTPNGVAVCQFGLAVNRRFLSAGQERSETCYVDILVWGRQGETVNQYMTKGSPIFLEGRLQMDQWEDKETGNKRSKLQIVAETVQFIGSRQGGADRDDAEVPAYEEPRPTQAPRASSGSRYAPESMPAMPEEAFRPGADDDIPF